MQTNLPSLYAVPDTNIPIKTSPPPHSWPPEQPSITGPLARKIIKVMKHIHHVENLSSPYSSEKRRAAIWSLCAILILFTGFFITVACACGYLRQTPSTLKRCCQAIPSLFAWILHSIKAWVTTFWHFVTCTP